MGPRKLLKEGMLLKAKSGRKLRAFLCSDILVLTEEATKSLYRMVRSCLAFWGRVFPQTDLSFQPLSLSEVEVRESTGARGKSPI